MQPGDLDPDTRSEPHPVAAPVISTEPKSPTLRAEFQRALSPPCLLWRAVVEDHGGQLSWEWEFVDEAAAERFLPLERAPGEAYGEAWRRCRLAERGDEVAAGALRDGE